MFERSVRFLQRHRWSIPLAVLSTLCFIQLANEVREQELEAFDQAFASQVVAFRGKLDGPMLFLTRAGGFLPMTVLAAVSAAVLAFTGRRKECVFVAIAGGGTLILNTTLKLLFHRARPDIGLGYMIPAPSSFSFPSGHAMGSMGVLSTLLVLAHVLRLRRPYRMLLIAIVVPAILGVALSRVYFGVHYPSDVIGGQLAGAAWVSAVTGWFYPRLLPGEETRHSVPEL